jgi:septation ring formation regulator EzrA
LEKQDYERLATVETELKSIKDYLVRMDGKLDAWQQNYLTRNEAQEMFRARDKELTDVNQDLDKLRDEIKQDKQSNKTLWPAWAAVGVSVIALVATVWLAVALGGK